MNRMNHALFPIRACPLLILLFLFFSTGSLGICKTDDGDFSGQSIYNRFVNKVKQMNSFSFECRYISKNEERVKKECIIRYDLQKPDKYRVKVIEGDKTIGRLICDGKHVYTLWPQGTTFFTRFNDKPKLETNVYLKQDYYRGQSVSHRISIFENMSHPVFNANVFFHGQESVMQHLDSIAFCGEEQVGDELCDKVEVSMMKGQRIRTYWLAKKDLLPRKMIQKLTSFGTRFVHEYWTCFKINPSLPRELFTWIPPKEFEERHPPTQRDLYKTFLQVGDPVPDFTLKDSAGNTLSLSKYAGKVIWIIFWRAG